MSDKNVIQFPVWKHEYLHSVLAAAYNVSRGGDKDDDGALFALLDDAGRTNRKRNPRRMMSVEESEVRMLNLIYSASIAYQYFSLSVQLADAFFLGDASDFSRRVKKIVSLKKSLA